MLALVETPSIQYHAPVWRCLENRYGVPVTAIYGSDFSVRGYRDAEFGVSFAWDTDLLSGYRSEFLSRVSQGGRPFRAKAALVVGYSTRFHQVTIWEAWRSGLPMIFRVETTDHATKHGPLKSWARDRALQWLLDHPEGARFTGEPGRRRVAAQWTYGMQPAPLLKYLMR